MREDDIRIHCTLPPSPLLILLLKSLPWQCDPAEGDVAFSQPTSSGKALMDAWGGGGVRVFVEDEQQNDTEE